MTTLIVIAKECIPGKVKTRLHPPYSLEQAADIASASLHDTLATLADVPATRRVLCFDGTTPPPAAAAYEVVHQVDGDLDERLAAIFDDVDGDAVLVGMDTPQLDAAAVAAAFAPWPEGVDAWFGPASDGGFWLLGLRAMPGRGDLIRGVPMSRDDTGTIQRARLVDAGLGIRDLEALRDIDDAEALAAVVARIPRSRTAAAARASGVAIRTVATERTHGTPSATRPETRS
ncbi:TIGR04282 family arsenosugar biosynthesis glycosyltransferase [Agrococcus jejuensis]|uniref:Glycosyltransferase n=1 Tax=Agrococcus jejuensis TaxID=399736 RepID=A0A1G8BD22_9MICO|nr:DUF2064 domain-containing protein [Agrococcus jejuensis]SDH30490.1 hypothetical protein SAMN04489720_0847 [Agrococcus jejuensis]